MGTKLQSRILHNLARCDCFDGVGRIFLKEAQEATRTPDLTVEAILTLWQEYYPLETAEEKQSNLILIYFDGKTVTQNNRELQKINYVPQFEAPIKNEELKPETYEPNDFPATNPEDRIIF
jgi:hypothetical protein